ncbi:MAG: hypothetical protein AAFX06_25750, partial [Planctomycetota bacterium]
SLIGVVLGAGSSQSLAIVLTRLVTAVSNPLFTVVFEANIAVLVENPRIRSGTIWAPGAFVNRDELV